MISKKWPHYLFVLLLIYFSASAQISYKSIGAF